jgi:hypothetical protein
MGEVEILIYLLRNGKSKTDSKLTNMSDISFFDDNALFLMGLQLFAPIIILLLVGFFFKSIEKPKTAKWLFYIALGYFIIILLLIMALMTSK